MKVLRKASIIIMTLLFISLFIASCGSTHKYGCPGKDRPSFRGGLGAADLPLQLIHKSHQNSNNPNSIG